ncbi:KTSC domain-containing protein [Acinetobacter sp. ANC 3781]|nr:KTSC domain-containing protein [Acinetobacter sp. ANC 3781]
MDMICVRSSSINAVGYNPDTNHLYIKFNNNPKTYTFYNLPFQIYNELRAAASKGRYYHRNIEGRYKGCYLAISLFYQSAVFVDYDQCANIFRLHWHLHYRW